MSNAATLLCACWAAALLSCSGSALVVEGTRPARRDIESALTTNGRIEAEQGFAVHAVAAGRVGELKARRGETVKKGQPLLRLVDEGQVEARDRADARLAAARARLVQLDAGLDPVRAAELKADLVRLEADRARASEDLARLRRLLARGAVARSEVDAQERLEQDLSDSIDALHRQLQAEPLEGRRAELKAAIREAEAELRDADQSLAALVLRAPDAGALFSLAVKEGDYLEQGSLAARIGMTDRVSARVFIDEPELGSISQGNVAAITADAYPGRAWKCRVETLATEVIEIGPRRVGEALCRADNPDRLLLPGMAVRVRVVTARAERALSVPRAAVLTADDQSFVWVAADGRAARREVSLGVAGPVFVEVSSGLAESDLVALPDGQGLVAGQRLRVRQAGGSAQ